MVVHSVFMDNIFIKSFKTLCEADICSIGLQMWLIDRGLDTEIVTIKEEVIS